MDMSPEDRDYYARAFRAELQHAEQQERYIRSRAAQSFWSVFSEIVSRFAPQVWDRMRDIWESIFRRWLDEG